VSLPLGRAVEQVRLLGKALGRKGLNCLQKAIVRFLERGKRQEA
jgi:hypothetical protein